MRYSRSYKNRGSNEAEARTRLQVQSVPSAHAASAQLPCMSESLYENIQSSTLLQAEVLRGALHRECRSSFRSTSTPPLAHGIRYMQREFDQRHEQEATITSVRAKAYCDVDFTVILNPCSGPCLGSLPDQVYLDEIPKLRAYPNIRTLGYVATHYSEKNIENVLAEIDIYARWPKLTNNTKMRVDGIFFDETPSTYHADDYEYLKQATRAVRNATTFRDRFVGMRTIAEPLPNPLTILTAHNPGLVSPAILNSKSVYQDSYLNLTDMTVVFEETFNKWIDKDMIDPLQSHRIRRSKLAVILHSLPNLSRNFLDFVIEQVEESADWVFLTDIKEHNEYYHSFSPMFMNIVQTVNGGERRRKKR